MSYILDALRRADAERDRGEVPSLHTQQYGALPGDDEPPRSRLLLIGAIVALSLALAAMLAWQFLRSEPAPALPAVASAAAPTRIGATPPATAPIAAPPAASSAEAAMKAKEKADDEKEEKPKKEAKAARAARAEAARERRARRQASTEPTGKTEKAAARATDKPGDKPAGDDRIYTRAELPEPIRRDLPQLAVGGASYSKDPASRMVILNGRVFHEGDKVAPGLVLQTIKLKAAVLAYKGYRFELAF